MKRNKEALITELRLWEGYLEKVAYTYQRCKEPYLNLYVFQCFHPFSFKLGPKTHLAGQSFTLADVTVFPTVATLFRFGSAGGTKWGSDVRFVIACKLSLLVP